MFCLLFRGSCQTAIPLVLPPSLQNASNVTNSNIFTRIVRPFIALVATNPLQDTPLVCAFAPNVTFASDGVIATGFALLGHVVPVMNEGTSRTIVLLNIILLLKLARVFAAGMGT
ncbi:hypothetical protein OG21DRAFT_1489112 [Imleria badia]|nr:hypothetical protein OG21DRAFT_1489112 [Imleria badia]